MRHPRRIVWAFLATTGLGLLCFDWMKRHEYLTDARKAGRLRV